MDDAILHYAAQGYGIPGSQLNPLPGGHFSHVYEFSKDDRDYVLRITPPNNEVDVHSMRAILEWMHFLSTHGASVSSPVLSRHNQLIELMEQEDGCYMIVVFEKAEGVLAEELSLNQWNDELTQRLGRTVGRMHALAKEYVPPDDSLKRPEWESIGNCFNPGQPLEPSEAVIGAKRENVWKYIHALPKDEECYGLVHMDLHFGNLYVDIESGTVTILDFDDCSYGWYVMDIALTLFDLLVLYPGADKEEFATRFMKRYLRGYTAENQVNAFWISQLPHFLKLLEIGIYTDLYKHYDTHDVDSWVGKFMANRKHRIENDIPYVNLDFENTLQLGVR